MSTEPEVGGAAVGPATAVGENPADRAARNPFYRHLMHLGLPVVFSVVLHVSVVGFLAFKTFQVLGPGRIEVGEYEASLTPSAADQLDQALNWAAASPLDTPDEAALDESLHELSALDVPDLNPRELDRSGAGGEGAGLGIGDGALALLGTGGGAGEAGSGGFGGGLGGGGPRIGMAGVWDLSVQANRIVYVVDFSGSIIVAGDELKRELKRSIGRLKPSQQFNVIIFYSTGAGRDERVRTESFKADLQPADEAIRKEFFAWIDQRAPRGGTEPLQAMQRALAMKPDAVFFFSDGYFEESVVGEISRANRVARARIHCLVFDESYLGDNSGLPPRDKEGSLRLKRVAEQNGGKTKIVTGRDLAR